MVSVPFQTILVALDESDAGQQAFVAAKTMAQSFGAKLVLIHVLDPHDRHSPQPLYRYSQSEHLPTNQEMIERYEKEWGEFVQRYTSLLKEKADEAIALGIETDWLQLTGAPGSTLCSAAKTAKADLLVVGSHQRRGMAEIMLGSTSNYITHYAPCSVLVAYAGQAEPTGNMQTESMQDLQRSQEKKAVAA